MQHGLNDPSQVVAFAWSAILLLSMPFALLGLIAIQVFQSIAPDNFQRMRERLFRFAAFALSLTAGAIHLALTPEHGREVEAWGVFFALVGLSQTASGLVLLFWARRWIYVISAFGNALLVAIYIMTRIVPPPLSPLGTPEEVEVVGIFTVLVEMVLVFTLISLLRVRWHTLSAPS